MAMSGPMVRAIAKMVVYEVRLMALVARIVAYQAEKDVSEAAQLSILAAFPSPPPSMGHSFSTEKQRKPPRHGKLSRQKRILTSSESNCRGICY